MSEHKPLDQIFSGREDCLGNYILEGSPEPGKKWNGRGISYPNSKYPHRRLTPEDYTLHFEGNIALGVVPVYLDGTCKWFAIDVDDYNTDHLELAKKIERLQIPLVHCRSKSGGAHLYGLFAEPVKATLALSLAKKWSIELGFDIRKTEIFPKQVRFDSEEAKGNWIIIPYFGGNKAQDFALDSEGKKIAFKDFYDHCLSKMITAEEANGYIKKPTSKVWSQDEIIEQSPPCVITMMNNHVREGDGRNNAASHLSWYFRKMDDYFHTDDWKDRLRDFSDTYFDPPLKYDELNQVIKNHSGAKQYKQRCDQIPMVSICDKDECLKRKFGIKANGADYQTFQFTGLTKIDLGDDPLWKPFVNGQPITVDTETLMSPRLFRLAAMKRFNFVIPLYKQADWDALITPLLNEALVIEHADIVSSYTKVDSCFRLWIAQVIEKSRSIDKLLDGLPYFDKKKSDIYFRHNDFVLEYGRVYKERPDDREIFMVLKASGFEPKKITAGGKKIDAMVLHVSDEDIWFNVATEEKF